MSVYLIRHGQSKFNKAFAETSPVDPMCFDSPLTELGKSQALETRDRIGDLDITHVVASPMRRAIQTAMHIFGDNHPISIDARVTEKVSHSCDVGSSPSVLTDLFSHLTFDHLPFPWWHGDGVDEQAVQPEPEEHFQSRVDEVKNWLDSWNRGNLAIVGHGVFFRELAGYHLKNCEIHLYRD